MASSHRDHLGRPVIAITGLGVVTSLGIGKDDNWSALTAGQSGIHAITRFATEGLSTRIAGTVDFIKGQPETAADLSYSLAELAAGEAVGEAGLPRERFPGPLFMAVPPVEIEWRQRLAFDAAGARDKDGFGRLISGAKARDWSWPYDRFVFAGVAERTAETFGTQGAPISLSTACASGATAVQLGVEAIRRGDCEAALCIGTDGSINTESLIRFSLLSALSTKNDVPEQAAKPFSRNRDGFVMAEGSGALVLESLDHATARGGEVLAILAGIGERADDFHRTRSKPDGSAVIGAIRNVLEDAGLTTDAIDYVNAHGTSTPENDKMEHFALDHVFGDQLATMAVSSNKSMVGHTLTAAGAVEAVFSILTMRAGRIPPTINYAEPDPDIVMDVVANKARDGDVTSVMSNSFGFGGQNVCLIMTAP